MDAAELRTFSRRVTSQLFDHLLPFWSGPALDLEHGGWMGWLSNDLKPDRSQPKGLIVNSRILWAFSAAHLFYPGPLHRQMAMRAYDVVMNRFWDPQHGGAFWRLDDEGNVLDDSKKTYGQAFCIYALAECTRAFGDAAALDRAKQLFELVGRHAHDPVGGGYIEVRRRDWSEAGPEARLSDKDPAEKKSMNCHLHVLEACATLHKVWPDPRVADCLKELIDLFLDKILDARTGHLNHFFDEHWQVRSDSYTFGHDIECSWLLCEAADELGDPALIDRVRAAVLAMANAVLTEGLDPNGGLRYEGRAGNIVDAGRECWPQAEAVVGFLNAFQLSGDERYFKAALRTWDFIESHLVDREHGEWFWRINEDGKPDPQLPKVSEWKGPYHGVRACLETLRRLANFIHKAKADSKFCSR